MNTPYISRQMRYFRVLLPLAAAAFALLASACSGSKVIPPELEEQIDSSVSFRDIQASPQALQGRMVLLGGEVLGSKAGAGRSGIGGLQLPVKDDDPPVERRTESQGRFLAIDRARRRPRLLSSWDKGHSRRGDVTGEETRRLDESSYRYPIVEVKHLYVWSEDATASARLTPSACSVEWDSDWQRRKKRQFRSGRWVRSLGTSRRISPLEEMPGL